MPELIPITLFLSVALVAILRPISRPLGRLLESMASERQPRRTHSNAADDVHLARIADLLEQISTRVDLMEDRMQFVERLVESKDSRRSRLTTAASSPAD
ncbi:MAG: hypothetical protein ACRELD_03950 [Longimicrobiales bacterium]